VPLDSPSPTSVPPSPVPVVVPDLGTAGEPVSLSAWFVEPGERIEAGEPLFEVALPGITCDVAATVSGRVSRLVKEIDALVAPGDVVAWVEPLESRI
jgi:pyruvate/2-oxoglutarate dehydrogenase complex dihydrolipoamide acyltransferase (E2) component